MPSFRCSRRSLKHSWFELMPWAGSCSQQQPSVLGQTSRKKQATVVMPACGAHMRKEKSLLRAAMPPQALRMRSLRQQHLSAELGLRCHWCGTSEPLPQRCGVCLLSYHEECCAQVVRNATAHKAQARCPRPDIFGDEKAHCKVCHEWVISDWSQCE